MAKVTFNSAFEAEYARLKNDGERKVYREVLRDAAENEGIVGAPDDAATNVTAADAYRADLDQNYTQDEAMNRALERISQPSPKTRRFIYDVGYNVTERLKKVGRRAEQLGFVGGLVADYFEAKSPYAPKIMGNVADSLRFSGDAAEAVGGLGQAGVLMTQMVTSGMITPEHSAIITKHAATNAAVRMWDPEHEPDDLELLDKDGNPLVFNEEEATALNEFYVAMAQTPQYAFTLAGVGAQALTALVTKNPKWGEAAGSAVGAAPVGYIVFRDSLLDAKKRGLSDRDAVVYALGQGSSEFLEQMFSIAFQNKSKRRIAKDGFSKHIFKSGAKEVGSEGATQMAQAGLEEKMIEGGEFGEGVVGSGEATAKAGALGGAGGVTMSTAISLPTAAVSAIAGQRDLPEAEENKRYKERVQQARKHREERDRILQGGDPDPTPENKAADAQAAVAAEEAEAQADAEAAEAAAAEDSVSTQALDDVMAILEGGQTQIDDTYVPDAPEIPVSNEPVLEEAEDFRDPEDMGIQFRSLTDELDALDDGEVSGESAAFERQMQDLPPELLDYEGPEGRPDEDLSESEARAFFGAARPKKKWPWSPDARYQLDRHGSMRLPEGDLPRPKWTEPVYEKPWRGNGREINMEAEETNAETDAIVRFFQVNAQRSTDEVNLNPLLKDLLFKNDEVFNLDKLGTSITHKSVRILADRMDKRRNIARTILRKESALGRSLNEGELREIMDSYAIERDLQKRREFAVFEYNRWEKTGEIEARNEEERLKKLEIFKDMKKANKGGLTEISMADGSTLVLGDLNEARKASPRTRVQRAKRDIMEKGFGERARLTELPTMREVMEAGLDFFGENLVDAEAVSEFLDDQKLNKAIARAGTWDEMVGKMDGVLGRVVEGAKIQVTNRRQQMLHDIVSNMNATLDADHAARVAANKAADVRAVAEKTPKERPKASALHEIIALGGGSPDPAKRRTDGMVRFLSMMIGNRRYAERVAPQATKMFNDVMAESTTPEDRAKFAKFQKAVHLVHAYGQTREGELGELNPDVGDSVLSLIGGRGLRAVLLAHRSRNEQGFFVEPAYFDTLSWDNIVKMILVNNEYPNAQLEYIDTEADPQWKGKTTHHILDTARNLGLTDGELNQILRGHDFGRKTARAEAMNTKAQIVLKAVRDVENDLREWLVRIGARPTKAGDINLRQPAAQVVLYNRGLLERNKVAFGTPMQNVVYEFAAQIQAGLEQRFDTLAIASVWDHVGAPQIAAPERQPAGLVQEGSKQHKQFIQEAVDKFVSGLTDNNLSVKVNNATGQLSIQPAGSLVDVTNAGVAELLRAQIEQGQDLFQILQGAGSITQREGSPGSSTIVITNPKTRRQLMVEATDINLVRAIRSRKKMWHGKISPELMVAASALKRVNNLRSFRQALITQSLPFIVYVSTRDALYQAPLHFSAGALARTPFVALMTGHYVAAKSAVTGKDLSHHENRAVRLSARHMRTASRFNEMSPQQTSKMVQRISRQATELGGSKTLQEILSRTPEVLVTIARNIHIAPEIGSRLGAAVLVRRGGLANNRNIRRSEKAGYSLPLEYAGVDSAEVIASVLGMSDAIGGHINYGDVPASTYLQVAGKTMEFVAPRALGFGESLRNLMDKADNESLRGALSQPLFVPPSKQISSRYFGGYVYQIALQVIYAMLWMLGMATWILNDEDEEGKPSTEALENYRSAPEFLRDMFMIFPTLGQMASAPDKPGSLFKVPIPFGVEGIPFATGLSIIEGVLLDKSLDREQATKILGRMMKAMLGEIYVMEGAVPWPLALWASLDLGKDATSPFEDVPFDMVSPGDKKLLKRLQISGVSETSMTIGFILNEIGFLGDISPAADVQPWLDLFTPGAGKYGLALLDLFSRIWKADRDEGEMGKTMGIEVPNQFWRALKKESGLVYPTDVQSAQGFFRRFTELDINARSADKVFGPRNRGRAEVGDITDLSPETERYRDTARLRALGAGDPKSEAMMIVARKVRDRQEVAGAGEVANGAFKIMSNAARTIRGLNKKLVENREKKFAYDKVGDTHYERGLEEKKAEELRLRKLLRTNIKEYNYFHDHFYLPEVKKEEARVRAARRRARPAAWSRQNPTP